MSDREKRLRKLVEVQARLKGLHETRRAGFLARAAAADAEARDLVDRFDTDGSLAGLFPELYHRRIGGALARKEENAGLAVAEARLVAAAKARGERLEETFRAAQREGERRRGDVERLEIVERSLKRKE